MAKRWTRAEKLTAISVVVGIASLLAAWMTVPQFQRSLGLESGSSSDRSIAIAQASSVVAVNISDAAPLRNRSWPQNTVHVYITGSDNKISIARGGGSDMNKEYVFTANGTDENLTLPTGTLIVLHLNGSRNRVHVSESLVLIDTDDNGSKNQVEVIKNL